MNYLVDTNIISEVRKVDQCNANVAAGIRQSMMPISI
jgi:hypothetical protein